MQTRRLAVATFLLIALHFSSVSEAARRPKIKFTPEEKCAASVANPLVTRRTFVAAAAGAVGIAVGGLYWRSKQISRTKIVVVGELHGDVNSLDYAKQLLLRAAKGEIYVLLEGHHNGLEDPQPNKEFAWKYGISLKKTSRIYGLEEEFPHSLVGVRQMLDTLKRILDGSKEPSEHLFWMQSMAGLTQTATGRSIFHKLAGDNKLAHFEDFRKLNDIKDEDILRVLMKLEEVGNYQGEIMEGLRGMLMKDRAIQSNLSRAAMEQARLWLVADNNLATGVLLTNVFADGVQELGIDPERKRQYGVPDGLSDYLTNLGMRDQTYLNFTISWRNARMLTKIREFYAAAALEGREVYAIVGKHHVPDLIKTLRASFGDTAPIIEEQKSFR